MEAVTKFFVAGHALIEHKNKYLVTRRSKLSSYMPLKWDIPGGIVEPGETLEEAIHREVNEETGLEIQIARVIYVYSNRDQIPVRQTFQAVYLCKFSQGEIRLNPSEHDSYKWLNYDNIASLDVIDFLRELVKAYHPETI
jgi:8-oxo-dGTP diphosphatase